MSNVASHSSAWTWRFLRNLAFAIGLAGLGFTLGAPLSPLTGEALARSAPQSFRELTDKVIDAVVNISAVTTSPQMEARRLPVPPVPRGTPFDDFFEEFFNRRQPGPTQPPQGQGPNNPRRGTSAGSGFVIDPEGIIITNNHVIGDANDITVIFNDGSRLKARVLGKDSKIDVAVLKVDPPKPLHFVKFGDSDAIRRGDWVLAIGNPFGLGGSVSAGIVSAVKRNIDSGNYDDYIQTDAAINKGNSGGPLFNMDGEVIGINTAILSPSGGSIGIGFAVPAALALPIINQLKEFGETRRGWLGVRIQPVDDATAEALGIGKARGALIAGVDERGPANSSGLRVGDVIIRFDGKDIVSSRDLPRIVAATPVGKTVEVVVIRKKQEVKHSVTLARLEDAERQGGLAAATPPNTQPAIKKALGLDLSPMTPELRRRFAIKDTVSGVVVLSVDPNSSAAEKRLEPGTVIVEVGQEPVNSPDDVLKRIDQLKKEGRKSVALYITDPQGQARFVAVDIN